ncbi:MAG: ABC transporter substrate-binding protein [Thermoplasmata archaeon]
MSPTKDPFRIGHLSTFYHTSLLLMSPEWPGTPLTAEWELFPTGPAMMEAFRQGRLAVGYIGLPPAMIGMARGVPIRAVAGGHMEGTVVIGPPGSKTFQDTAGNLSATIAQFRGGAIGTPTEGSIHDVILRDLLRREGLADEVEVKNFLQADLLPDALADGDLAAAAGTPALAVAGERWVGSKLLIPPSYLWPHNPSYGIVARADVIEETPARLEAFLRAHEEATALIRTQPDVAATITARLVSIIDAAFVLDTYQISPKYCGALPPSYVEATMAFVPILQELRYMARPLVEEEVFDTRFLPRFHPADPHYEQAGALAS